MAAHIIPPMATDPKLLKLLEESKVAWEKMTPEEKEAMIQKQRESWARQEMD